jgi:hypothetical protein
MLTDEATRNESQDEVQPTTRKKEDVVKMLENMKEQMLSQAEQLVALETQLRLARGTKDILKPTPQGLDERAEEQLRSRILSTEELAKSVGEDVDTVRHWIRKNRRNVADIGVAMNAKWFWKLNDDSPQKVVQDLVFRIISTVPMTTAQLSAQVGVRMPKINAALVAIQRNPTNHIYNTGSDYRGVWYILPPHARRANLAPIKKPQG